LVSKILKDGFSGGEEFILFKAILGLRIADEYYSMNNGTPIRGWSGGNVASFQELLKNLGKNGNYNQNIEFN
jgi:hypothetical protein